jgi:hypothetical protein
LEFGKWKIAVILRAINHWENENPVGRKVDELKMRFVGGKSVNCCALKEVRVIVDEGDDDRVLGELKIDGMYESRRSRICSERLN